jgi:hypothetical protein
MFAGIDRSDYPGDNTMQWLWDNTNLFWTGFYLGPAPSHPDTSWMGRRSFLKQVGWGLAPLYVGQQAQGRGSHIVTAAQGKIDGAHAASLARTAGFPGLSVLYLDMEQGPPLQQSAIDYYRAWVQAVFDNNFYPAVYCSYLLAAKLMVADFRPLVWVFHIPRLGGSFHNPYPESDTAKSGYSLATMWQLAQQVSIDGPSGKRLFPFDLDSSSLRDPSTFLSL